MLFQKCFSNVGNVREGKLFLVEWSRKRDCAEVQVPVTRSLNLVWKIKHYRCNILVPLENKQILKNKTKTTTKNPSQNKHTHRVGDRQERVSFSAQRKSQFTFRDAGEMLA